MCWRVSLGWSLQLSEPPAAGATMSKLDSAPPEAVEGTDVIGARLSPRVRSVPL